MAGTLNIALAQQIDANGAPLAGALIYFFVVGTVATPQNSYQDIGLTIQNPNPLVADQYGRIPMFYLADGQVHVRLTDANGVVIFDYPSMQVIGPSSGAGGGGSVDPSTIFATGDWKWRPTSEVLTGWVKSNGQTIGSATSGATQRANADTQNLFIYLWNNFPNSKCPVSGGRGASGLADFNANKTIGLYDMRDKAPFGLDDMGSTAAGGILSGNVTSGGGDGPTTPAAFGGESNHTLTLAEAPTGQLTLNDPGHSHGLNNSVVYAAGGTAGATNTGGTATQTGSAKANVSLTDHAGGGAHNNMPPFALGTWYVHL